MGFLKAFPKVRWLSVHLASASLHQSGASSMPNFAWIVGPQLVGTAVQPPDSSLTVASYANNSIQRCSSLPRQTQRHLNGQRVHLRARGFWARSNSPTTFVAGRRQAVEVRRGQRALAQRVCVRGDVVERSVGHGQISRYKTRL